MSYQLVNQIINEFSIFRRVKKITKNTPLAQPKFDMQQVAEVRNRIIHIRQEIEILKKNRQNPELIRLKKIELSQARSRLRLMLKNQMKPETPIINQPSQQIQ